MASQNLKIEFKIGIHGRPAALLIQKVKSYADVEVLIKKDGKSANAKSLMGLLSLGINQNSLITVEANGKDEEKVIAEIIDYISNVLSKEN